jgi:hypothetical protein
MEVVLENNRYGSVHPKHPRRKAWREIVPLPRTTYAGVRIVRSKDPTSIVRVRRLRVSRTLSRPGSPSLASSAASISVELALSHLPTPCLGPSLVLRLEPFIRAQQSPVHPAKVDPSSRASNISPETPSHRRPWRQSLAERELRHLRGY